MLTPTATLSFPHLVEPSAFGDGEPSYTAVLLFDKAAQATPEFAALKKACADAVKEKFGDKINMKAVRNPFRDGNEKDYAGYRDTVYITIKSKTKPVLVDEDTHKLINVDRVFPGAKVIANVNPAAYDYLGNKGVTFYVAAVQFLVGGERLDGRPDPVAAFTPQGNSAVDEIPFG
jgi:hypothetical protein